jgi:ribosomal protein L33
MRKLKNWQIVVDEEEVLGFKPNQKDLDCDWTCNVLGYIYGSLFTALSRVFAGFKFWNRVCNRLLAFCPRNPEFATGSSMNFDWLLLTSSDTASLASSSYTDNYFSVEERRKSPPLLECFKFCTVLPNAYSSWPSMYSSTFCSEILYNRIRFR